jgi:hypothetical protein
MTPIDLQQSSTEIVTKEETNAALMYNTTNSSVEPGDLDTRMISQPRMTPNLPVNELSSELVFQQRKHQRNRNNAT